MEPNQVRLGVFLSVLALFFLIESFYSKRDWETPRSKRLLFHGAIAMVNTFFVRFCIALPLILLANFVRDQDWGLMPLLGLEGIPEILFSLIVLDMFDYWWHRWNHTIPLTGTASLNGCGTRPLGCQRSTASRSPFPFSHRSFMQVVVLPWIKTCSSKAYYRL